MDGIANRRWLRMAMVVAAVYIVVGIVLAGLIIPTVADAMRIYWRLGAWGACGVAFGMHLWHGQFRPGNSPVRPAGAVAARAGCGVACGMHIWHEHFRPGNSPVRAAWHVAAAVAVGAIGIAVWVNVQSYMRNHQSPLAIPALVLFPVVLG